MDIEELLKKYKQENEVPNLSNDIESNWVLALLCLFLLSDKEEEPTINIYIGG